MSILSKIRDFNSQRTQIKAFKSQPNNRRKIVFYAESKADWPHIGPIVDELINRHGVFVSYLTSDINDPILITNKENFASFYVGSGSGLIMLFKTINCKVLITSLPDIETYHLKRSINEVHYVYVFHSMASTHALYREAAFDHYDTIFTVGPHHEKEIRKREKMLNLHKKTLVPHGYARLDTLISKSKKTKKQKNKKTKILLASSWGPSSITNRCALPLIRILLEAGMEVIYRPHPMSQWHAQEKLKKIQKEYKNNPNFIYETDMRTSNSLVTSDALITEWSGIALEYAFTYGKPVYSIDTPRKVNNPNYKKLGVDTIEDWARHEIGAVISENNLKSVIKNINKNINNPKAFAKASFNLRNKWIYNIGKSSKVASDYIVKLSIN